VGPLARLARWLRGAIGEPHRSATPGLPGLPAALRRDPLAPRYVEAATSGDHRGAATAAGQAAEAAITAGAWWAADAWSHRALWHFERIDMTLAATRTARRIGDIRVAGGDPDSARRYYAEAISEARDIGAEREQGLAALGMGRAEMDRGDVTTARRLAEIAETLLASAGAPADEIAAAHALRGEEKAVREAADGGVSRETGETAEGTEEG
jgi:tetratricopeptide (TPR) repeat protein